VLTETSLSKSQAQGFEKTDIKIGFKSMQISCQFDISDKSFTLLINKQKESIATNEGDLLRELKKKKRSREMREVIREKEAHDSKDAPHFTPDFEKIEPLISSLFPEIKKSKEQTLVLFFSTRRSLVVDQKLSTTSTSGGQAAAFDKSLLINRDFNIREIAEWYRTREVLAEESPQALKHLVVLRSAITQFMPEYHNPHVVEFDTGAIFMIEKEGIPISVAQLSDGERGVLSLVLDLSKRLSQANPELDDPNKDGVAIVLIDELDLHLHPLWQRTIIENLTKTFPNCQFIATTHSPFIIQSLRKGDLINLDQKNNDDFKDQSIEDITENIMGVDMPQKSQRYLNMMEAAEEYYKILNKIKSFSPNELNEAEKKLNELMTPFSDEPAFQALLKIERASKIKK